MNVPRIQLTKDTYWKTRQRPHGGSAIQRGGEEERFRRVRVLQVGDARNSLVVGTERRERVQPAALPH